MAKGRQVGSEIGRRTVHVAGFNAKYTTKHLLFELFHQGGPVTDITWLDTHAYVLFQHEESVPYCLALFSDIELHGRKLKLSPRIRTKTTYSFLDYLAQVRNKIKDDYMRIQPPDLPAKIYPAQKFQAQTTRSPPKKAAKKQPKKKPKEKPKGRISQPKKNSQKSKKRTSNKQTVKIMKTKMERGKKSKGKK